MNANGVLASMCFPSFPRLCGQVFAEAQDKDLAAVLVRAYNDWHVQSWCGKHPGRFIPLGLVPFWDVELTVAELRATRGHGRACRLVLGEPGEARSPEPARRALGSVLGGMSGPRDRAVPPHRVVVDDHRHRTRRAVRRDRDAAAHEHRRRGGGSRVVTGAAQVPDAEDRTVGGRRRLVAVLPRQGRPRLPQAAAWTGQDYGDRLPSDVFRERIVTCFLDDRVTPEVAERSGTELMTWECDYPHSDSDWPESPEVALAGMDGLDDATINRLTHENAMRIFQLRSVRPSRRRPSPPSAHSAPKPPRRASTPRPARCAPGSRPSATTPPRNRACTPRAGPEPAVPPSDPRRRHPVARTSSSASHATSGCRRSTRTTGPGSRGTALSTSAARFANEAITIVAFDDMAAFEPFAAAERESAVTRSLRDRRNGVQTRLLRPDRLRPVDRGRRRRSPTARRRARASRTCTTSCRP